MFNVSKQANEIQVRTRFLFIIQYVVRDNKNDDDNDKSDRVQYIRFAWSGLIIQTTHVLMLCILQCL